VVKRDYKLRIIKSPIKPHSPKREGGTQRVLNVMMVALSKKKTVGKADLL
jgi:hypothetical protein